MWCEITGDPVDIRGVRGGIKLPQASALLEDYSYRALPLRPIWPGLAADTAVFAVPLFILWSFARVARSNRRLSRGRCPLCAYDLRSDLRTGCPECGWNRPATASTESPAAPA